MGRRGRLAGAVLLLCAAAPAGAGESLPAPVAAAFDACMEHPRMRPEPLPRRAAPAAPARDRRKVEAPGLADLCPEVHAAIASAPFARFLPDDWAKHPTPGRLAQFRRLFEAPAAVPAAYRLDPSGIAPILEQVRVSEVQREKSLWQRFKDWLGAILERRAAADDSGWLADWIRKHAPSARAMDLVAYGVMVLLIAGAAWVVVSELRAHGLLRRPGQAVRGAAAAAAAEPAVRRVADAGDDELPALLIGLLLERLRALGLLRDRASMTHRELIAAARLPSQDDRTAFATLVTTAERLRYGSAAPAREQQRLALDAGRALLTRLAALPQGAA